MRRTRFKRGLSQAEAARQAKVSPSFLCQVETGVRKPSRRLAERLEQVYGLRPGQFVKKYAFPHRGGRPVDKATADAMRDLLKAVSIDPQAPTRVPRRLEARSSWRDWRGNVDNPLWPIAPHLGKAAQERNKPLQTRQPGHLVVTYCCNLPELAQHLSRPSVYRPRVVDVRLP